MVSTNINMFGITPAQRRSEIPREFEDIAELQIGQPDDKLHRVALADDVFDSIEEWESKSREDDDFSKDTKADLGHLAVTTFESPGESDPFFGQIHSSILAIRSSPSAFDSQRKPPRPKFDN